MGKVPTLSRVLGNDVVGEFTVQCELCVVEESKLTKVFPSNACFNSKLAEDFERYFVANAELQAVPYLPYT